jgi:hypothetical protein
LQADPCGGVEGAKKDEKIASGLMGFHSPAIVFHHKITDKAELRQVCKKCENGEADPIHPNIDYFFIAAENHNIKSSKKVVARLTNLGNLETAKKFERFTCEVLAWYPRDRSVKENDYQNMCINIYKGVSVSRCLKQSVGPFIFCTSTLTLNSHCRSVSYRTKT